LSGDRNDPRISIMVTNKIYEIVQLQEIEMDFYKSDLSEEIPFQKRGTCREDILKLPSVLDLREFKRFWKEKLEFKKLTKADQVAAEVKMGKFIINGTKRYFTQ